MLFGFRNILVFLLLSISYGTFSQNIPETLEISDLSIGKTVQIYSKVLKEERSLNIYLPPSYSEDSLNKYDIIYLLDGSLEEDFIHIAGLSQFASFPWINNISESIIVGIANIDRKRDFTFPSRNAQDIEEFPTSGGSNEFIDFLELELKPFIESKYHVTDQYTLIGQSLGGLLAAEILLERPSLFNKYIIVSPSLWWDDESLLNRKLPKFENPISIYVAVGKEGEVMERTAKELHKKLEQAQSAHLKVYFDYLPDKKHGDALHQAVYNAFIKMK